MKKTLALILALVLCLSLAACVSIPVLPLVSNMTVEPPAASDVPTTAAPTAPLTQVPTEVPTEAPTTEAPITEAPITEAPTAEAPATEAPTEARTAGLAHGSVDGNTYTNETLNIRFTIPDGWVFYTEEQIAAQNNLTAEMFEGTDIAEVVRTGGQLIDMAATRADGSNANLVIQPSQAVLSLYTDQELFEMLENSFTSQYAAAGMEVVSYEVLDVPALGEGKAALHIGVKMSSIEMAQYQVWLRDNPDFYGVLTITSMSNDLKPETVLEGLSSLH